MEKSRRSFKRYPKLCDVDLRINNTSLKGKTLDYSLDGLGVFVEGMPALKKGYIINFVVKEPEIGANGRVVWLDPRRSGLRLGIRIVGGLKGRVSDFKLTDTLVGLQLSRKTGILKVESGDIVKRIYIKNGDVIFSDLNQGEDHLGDLLLREGRITREQFDLSVRELQRTKQRQGTVLVKLGYLKPQELAKVVRHQAEEIILSLFGLEHGVFAFEEAPLPTEDIITMKLSAANLIYHGTKNLRDSQFLESSLPSVDDVPFFSSDTIDLLQGIVMDEAGKKVTACIDGRTSIKEIISITQLDNIDALKTIRALLDVRIIDVSHRGGSPDKKPEDILDEIISGGVSGETTREEESEIASQCRDMIEDMHRKYESLGYYGVLGVNKYSPLGEIKSAYYNAARKFHPDMHFHLTDDSLRNKLGDIFTYIYAAYATLSNQQKRMEYDKLMTLNPGRSTSNRDKAKAFFEEGKKELRKNDFPDAELLFGQAIYFDNTVAEYHYYYGLTLFKRNNLVDAEKSYAKALSLDPQNPSYLAELGFVFMQLGFPRRAKGFFRKALMISPNNVRALEGMKLVELDL